MPVDELVEQLFVKKEFAIVDWLKKTLKLQCVIEPLIGHKMLEIYGTDNEQIIHLCKEIKNEFDVLDLDQSFTDMVSEGKLNEFIKGLERDDDVVFKRIKGRIRICAFKPKRKEIYDSFLTNLN